MDNALHYFNVSRTQGLSSEAAKAKLAKYGPNGMWWLMRDDINLHRAEGRRTHSFVAASARAVPRPAANYNSSFDLSVSRVDAR